jgi:hypothetical protein
VFKTLNVASKGDTYEEPTVELRNPVDVLCGRWESGRNRDEKTMLPVVVLAGTQTNAALHISQQGIRI